MVTSLPKPARPDRLPVATVRSRADVATGAPGRYAKQLVAHLGRKVEFTTDGTTSTANVAEAAASVVVGDGVLTLLAAGEDEDSVARAEHVLASHLERFGRRDGLTVSWTRTTRADTARAVSISTQESA